MNSMCYAIKRIHENKVLCRQAMGRYACRDSWSIYNLDYFKCVRSEYPILTFNSPYDALDFIRRNLQNSSGIEIVNYNSCSNMFGTAVWRNDG